MLSQHGGAVPFELDAWSDAAVGMVAIGTMHVAKGLELRSVAVMACDEEVLPLPSRIEEAAEGADRDNVYDTEFTFSLDREPSSVRTE